MVGELRVEGQPDGRGPRTFRSGIKGRGGRDAKCFFPPPGDSKVQQYNIAMFAKEFCDFGCNTSATKCNKVQRWRQA
jgi:hypothetical protein